MSGMITTLLCTLAAPTYSITHNTNGQVPEGGTITFTMNQTNVPAGTTFSWDLVSVLGTVDQSDFTSGSITGSFTSNGNPTQDFQTFTLDASYATPAEGLERFYIRLYVSGTVVATSASIYITIDKSLSSASGQILYRTPGTYTFIPPTTQAYCLLAVGAGGSGAAGGDAPGGGGAGGLAWLNGQQLGAGTSYAVVVGGGSSTSFDGNAPTTPIAGPAGTHSYFSGTTICRGINGTGAPATNGGRGAGGGAAATGGTARATATGGQGGIASTADAADTSRESGPGGGTAGYTTGGTGGSGGATAAYTSSSTGTAGSGCGAGGYANTNGPASGGGGTGPWGRGANGTINGTLWGNPADYGDWWPYGGGGGSGGDDGQRGDTIFGGWGGWPGGGGGGAEIMVEWGYTWGYSGGGNDGCVRVLWGSGRAYPTTSVADV